MLKRTLSFTATAAFMLPLSLFAAAISMAADQDADGVFDEVDNCVLVANGPQRDTDGDGIGNYCDPDFNNDGTVNFLDLFYWQEHPYHK